MATLAEFPDRQLLGEDVIWSTATSDAGFLSSHRLVTTGTQPATASSARPTGKRFDYPRPRRLRRQDDVIYDEWLIRDTVGHRAASWASTRAASTRDLIAREGGPEKAARRFTPADASPAPTRPRQRQRVGRSASPTS